MILLTTEQQGLRVGDQQLTQSIQAMPAFQTDGGFDYRYEADGERIPGTYRVMPESTVCTDYANGFSRCDMIVQAGQRYVMIIENGERYPIRSRTAIE